MKQEDRPLDEFFAATLTVNGTAVTRRVQPRQHLIDFLRDELLRGQQHAGGTKPALQRIAFMKRLLQRTQFPAVG